MLSLRSAQSLLAQATSSAAAHDALRVLGSAVLSSRSYHKNVSVSGFSWRVVGWGDPGAALVRPATSCGGERSPSMLLHEGMLPPEVLKGAGRWPLGASCHPAQWATFSALCPWLRLLQVVDHYEKPRNVGSFDKNDPNVGTGLVGAPACGDVMKLQIKVRLRAAGRAMGVVHWSHCMPCLPREQQLGSRAEPVRLEGARTALYGIRDKTLLLGCPHAGG